MNSFRPVVPPVGLELFTDTEQFVGDIGSVASCRVVKCSGTRVQGRGGFGSGSGTDPIENAAGDLLCPAEFTDRQCVRLSRVVGDDHGTYTRR